MPKLLTPASELYYESHGNGEPLLLIAGMGAPTSSWGTVTTELAKQYRVIVFDHRDIGQSRLAETDYDLSELMADTVALLDHLAIESAYVVGHSMGGAVAQLLALQHPQRIKRLMLYATAAKFNARSLYMLQLQYQLWQAGINPELLCRYSLSICAGSDFLADDKVSQAKLDELLHNPNPMPIEAYARQLRAIEQFDLRQEVHNIQSLTWILAPLEDVLTPPSDCQWLAGQLPHCRYIDIANSGHCFHWQEPERFAILVERMINRKLPDKTYDFIRDGISRG